MIHTPYQSRAGSVYDTESILAQIEKSEVLLPSSGTSGLAEYIGVEGVAFITHDSPDVPGFMHPLIRTSSKGDLRSTMVYVDARPFATKQKDGTWKVRSENDFRQLIQRAKLSYHWAMGEVTDFIALGELPLKLYLNWVGNMVGRHLAIDPLTQFKVSALAGMYYLSQHYELDLLDQESYQIKMADKVSRAMRSSIEEVRALVQDGSPLYNLEVFVEALRTKTGSVRLEDVSVAYLFNVVGGSWFGNNARELTAIALDHPPTWISILNQSMNDRSYRKAGLSQLTNTLTRAQEHKDFTRSVELLLKG